MGMKSFLLRCYRHVEYKRANYLIDCKKGKKITISIADLLSCNFKDNLSGRFDIIVRLLTVEKYGKRQENSFIMYEKMQNLRVSGGYSDTAIPQFKELIESYENDGYDRNSYILVDRNFQLIDGSHRIAMALYYGYSDISAIVIDCDYPVDYSIFWFITHGFSSDNVDELISRYNNLIGNRKCSFSCEIWSPAVPFAKEIIKDLQLFGEVKNIRRYRFSKDLYNNLIRQIYSIDDIESWKIDKKIEFMNGFDFELISLDLVLDQPDYREKEISAMPISKKGELIKKSIRSKYQHRVVGYFYDVIMHIGDNVYQSDFIRNLLKDYDAVESIENRKII